MDPTEDLSARVLLKHILSTEPPRTPITRSASKTQSTSSTRSTQRQRQKDAGAQTPQDMLRRSLRHKMRESITRKSLPANKRRTASFVQKKINTPASSSVLFNDGDTPRHILMNILRTEPTKSPVVHERAVAEEPQPSPDDSSITRKRPSIELSGLDLPDLTIANPLSTAKGLSRKRPRRSLNVTAFEKRLKDGKDVEEETEESVDDHSSLSLSSSTSLSLKTPFADVRTEKKGLQRRVSNRRKITEEEFGAAVYKRQMAGTSFVQAERSLTDATNCEGFTLGLSKLSEPDITTDILHCNTALYAQPDAMTSSFSIVATQDKPTVMASQLQRQMEESEEEEEGKLGKEKSTYAFPTEEAVKTQDEVCLSLSEEDADAAEAQKEEEESPADGQLKTAAAMSEEEENRMEVQTSAGDSHTEEEKGGVDCQPEEDAARSQHVEEETPEASQTKEDDAVESQTGEEEEALEGEVDSQPEEDAAKSQSKVEIIAPDSQIEDEGAVDSLTDEEGAVDVQSEVDDAEAGSQSAEEENVAEGQSDHADLADSQPEDESDGIPDEEDGEVASEQLEHINRRAHRSEGGLIKPLTEAGGDLADTTDAGWSDHKSKAHTSLELASHESGQLHTGIPDLGQTETESDADKENSCLLEGTLDIQESPDLNDHSPEEAAAQDPAEQEEEEEEYDDDEEGDAIPSKTPAFIRQKISFLQTSQPASPSVFKNIQPSSGEADPPPKKQKQVRRKRSGRTEKEVGLPKSYLMNVFKHYAKTKVSADIYPVLKEIMDKYFDRMAEDLETFALHAKRKTIEVEDAELLLKRQGHVNNKVPVEVLIEKYLRMDQRKLLIPIATSGNVVVPKMRR